MTKLTKTQRLFDDGGDGGRRAPGRRKRKGTDDSVGLVGHKSIGPKKSRTVPPPPGKAELSRTRPPRGRRTPATPREAPEYGPPLPANAPGWMRRARRVLGAMQQALEAGEISESTEAAIERAFAAFELGLSDKQISRVAHLVERAHSAIRETSRAELESAYHDCAEVLHQGLPVHVQKKMSFDTVVDVVRRLRREADAWKAVVDGTAELLGWSEAATAHGAHAIRVALLAEPPSSRESN